MLSILKYWRRSGLDQHKVQAFTSLSLADHGEARSAVYVLGGLYIGIALPDFAVHGDMLAVPWVVPAAGPVGSAAPDPSNGHCIPAVGFDDAQLWVVTWGALKSMSWAFYDAYVDECYGIVSGDVLEASGTSPQGFDLATLEKDLSQL
jgi:hypothetical protein